MFGERIGLSLDAVELMHVENEYVEFVQAQELPKSWTTAKKIHAAERGRLDRDDYQVDEAYRTLIFQATFSKNNKR